jgi:hypothetical protein
VRRLLRAFPFTIAAILVLGGGIAFAAHAALTQTSAPVPPIPPAGMPALKPHFTESDVRAYVAQHPFSLAWTTDGRFAQISRVQFMTGAQANALLDDSTGAAPNATVCIVWFAGPLQSFHGLTHIHPPTPGQTPVPPKPEIFAGGVEVFDTTTGNLLLSGLHN